MSVGTRIPWEDAYALAADVAEDLAPVVVRSKAVGSLRRRSRSVGDLEFLVEPRMIDADLFGGKKAHVEPIRAVAEKVGTVVKGGDRMIQVTNLYGAPDVTLDLYIVRPPANWYCLLAIRTGPWELGKHAVTLLRDHGLRHEGGRILRRDGSEYPVESEVDFFEAAGLPFLPPHLRDDPAARKPMRKDARA